MALLQRLKSLLGLGSPENKEDRDTIEVNFDQGTDARDSGPIEDTAPEDTDEDEAAVPVDAIDGIGPAYRERLTEAGIETVDDLATADPDAVAADTDLSPTRVEGWIDRAHDRS
ncbi:MAG: helix-hairpin-helix domain-containing protein [Halobacteriaceae archaeon]